MQTTIMLSQTTSTDTGGTVKFLVCTKNRKYATLFKPQNIFTDFYAWVCKVCKMPVKFQRLCLLIPGKLVRCSSIFLGRANSPGIPGWGQVWRGCQGVWRMSWPQLPIIWYYLKKKKYKCPTVHWLMGQGIVFLLKGFKVSRTAVSRKAC